MYWLLTQFIARSHAHVDDSVAARVVIPPVAPDSHLCFVTRHLQHPWCPAGSLGGNDKIDPMFFTSYLVATPQTNKQTNNYTNRQIQKPGTFALWINRFCWHSWARHVDKLVFLLKCDGDGQQACVVEALRCSYRGNSSSERCEGSQAQDLRGSGIPRSE